MLIETQKINLPLLKISGECVEPNLYVDEISKDPTLEITELTLADAVSISNTLENKPETLSGKEAVRQTLETSGFPYAILPYRLLFPGNKPDAFRWCFNPEPKPNIAGSSGSIAPAEDVFIVRTKGGKNTLAFLQRSSIWSALYDGVATARINLTQAGEIINVGGVQPCLRNEVKETVKGWREIGFTQADCELAALKNQDVTPQRLDLASIAQMVQTLENFGIPRQVIQIRVNNYMDIIFQILDKVPFLERQQFCWGCLDQMATARVSSDLEKYIKLQRGALGMLELWKSQKKLTPPAISFLETLVQTGQYDEDLLQTNFPLVYQALSNLKKIVQQVQTYPDIKILIDPLSIRAGIPQYDRTTMQADVFTKEKIFPEIAGGGAYTKAAKQSWRVLFNEEPPMNFYMVGFALGLLRIKTILDYLGSQQ